MGAAGLFIDGAQRAASGATHPVDDPSTGQPWLEVALGDAEDVDAAVAAAARAATEWGPRPTPARAAVLRAAAALAPERHEHLARTESRDVGKPIADAQVELGRERDVEVGRPAVDHRDRQRRGAGEQADGLKPLADPGLEDRVTAVGREPAQDTKQSRPTPVHGA